MTAFETDLNSQKTEPVPIAIRRVVPLPGVARQVAVQSVGRDADPKERVFLNIHVSVVDGNRTLASLAELSVKRRRAQGQPGQADIRKADDNDRPDRRKCCDTNKSGSSRVRQHPRIPVSGRERFPRADSALNQ